MKRTVNSLEKYKIIKFSMLPLREVLINIENILLQKEKNYLFFYTIIPQSINIYLGPTVTVLDAWNTTIKMAKI